ncbi:hypothetical protein VNO77_28680 [Canavalia gladiata]|uniref:Uncharacterized protein n=1 Tax=Canavalia gladiata TaxID=3824 RepID=A0AAN9KZJ0_CANGL
MIEKGSEQKNISCLLPGQGCHVTVKNHFIFVFPFLPKNYLLNGYMSSRTIPCLVTKNCSIPLTQQPMKMEKQQ